MIDSANRSEVHVHLTEHRRSFDRMRAFYDWFGRFYGFVERSFDSSMSEIAKEKLSRIPGAPYKTALDYACGSGLLTLKLAQIFKSVEGRDSSAGMLDRARTRAAGSGIGIVFKEGNLLEPRETPGSYDYVFVSLGLHLFSEETIPAILTRLLDISREAVIIIDHNRKWRPFLALAEWIEGSYYDKFITLDFPDIAKRAGAVRFEEAEISGLTVMTFYKNR